MQCTKLTYDFANLFNMSDGLALPQRPLIIPAVIRQVIHFFPRRILVSIVVIMHLEYSTSTISDFSQ